MLILHLSQPILSNIVELYYVLKSTQKTVPGHTSLPSQENTTCETCVFSFSTVFQSSNNHQSSDFFFFQNIKAPNRQRSCCVNCVNKIFEIFNNALLMQLAES